MYTLEHVMLQPRSLGTPLRASLSAFLLDREAARCSPKTIEHHQYTCGSFAEWLGDRGVSDAEEIEPHHIRTYLVSLQQRGLKKRRHDTPMYVTSRPGVDGHASDPLDGLHGEEIDPSLVNALDPL